ncbi:MAG: TonB-dependent receptor plug domain-containing protein [bacterium]
MMMLFENNLRPRLLRKKKQGPGYKRTIQIFLCITLALSPLCEKAIARSKEEMKILHMFYKEEQLVVTPGRYPKPISHAAENITVVSAEEIEMMNAHTLTDVLNNIPGVQTSLGCGPGSVSIVNIQGSEKEHVRLMIDGVTLNDLYENNADISTIPVRNIEKIEIIKGPASSSWGSSLGGIIHIITKSAGGSQGIGGTLSASFGERNTMDQSSEVFGRSGNLGYYLYAGNLDSDGFCSNSSCDEGRLYTKLRWAAGEKGSLLFTLGYNNGSRGIGEFPIYSAENDFEYLFSSLTLAYSINKESNLHLSFKTSEHDAEFIYNQIDTGVELSRSIFDDRAHGCSATLDWKQGIHTLAVGFDMEEGKLESPDILDGRQTLENWGIFANDTVAFDYFSFTPGIRYDYTNTNGDFLSPSLGMVSRVAEKTILRGYVARGFNIPPLPSTFMAGMNYVPNPDLQVEKIWSVQVGIESTAIRYFWFKTTLFRHNIWDAITSETILADPNKFTVVNKAKQRRQGIEVELKTVPVYDTSLFAGFSFVDAKDRETGERLINVPKYTYDIGIHYDKQDILRAYLKGHYIWWHTDPYDPYRGQFHTFVWDVNLMKRIYRGDKKRADAFFSVHNILNGSQYPTSLYKNSRRWVEAGVRFKF